MGEESLLLDRDDDGSFKIVVDCDIRINVPDLRAGGSRKLMNEIEWLE